jgi:hypothetical protein
VKKRKTRPTATRGKLTIFAQLCNHIPGHVVAKLARETGVETMTRTVSAWSHVVALLYAQLTHAIGLNNVCDALRHHVGWLARTVSSPCSGARMGRKIKGQEDCVSESSCP